MRIKQINLDDEGDPADVLVQLTRQEALYLTVVLGGQSGHTANAIMPGGDVPNSAMYCELTGRLWNCFYEDGVNGALRGDLS